jgi:glyoxylate/hydroxypyruvate reductase A
LRDEAPVLVWACTDVPTEIWLPALQANMPKLEIRLWPDIGDAREVDYVFAWKPPLGLISGLPNLRAVFSLGAGVEGLLADPELSPELPLIRMVDPSLAAGMAEYVLMQVLHYHRGMPAILAHQRAGEWKPARAPLAGDRRIGILGFGNLGRRCAETLLAVGFDVAIWSRNEKTAEGITCFSGSAALPGFLARSEIVVCLLPLTPDTQGILNAKAFAAMPQGSFVINAGRGGHLVEADLLAALESGHIAAATLDVFETEPLPAGHPFWAHPRVTVTPHVSALTQPRTAAPLITENITRDLVGLPMLHHVDRTRGY